MTFQLIDFSKTKFFWFESLNQNLSSCVYSFPHSFMTLHKYLLKIRVAPMHWPMTRPLMRVLEFTDAFALVPKFHESADTSDDSLPV